MTDVYSSQTRSQVMRMVQSENSGLEQEVRSSLRKRGFRYRLHKKNLPGKPDIVLAKYGAVVFVHGCFWHQHKNCVHAKRPKSNTGYWNRKLDRNIQRDNKNVRKLRNVGWKVIILWECQIKRSDKWLNKFEKLTTQL